MLKETRRVQVSTLSYLHSKTFITFFVLVLFAVQGVVSIPKGEKYQVGQKVEIFANTIGPFNNPSETFEYYSLPFCKPPEEELKRTKQTFGMNIEGDRLFSSLYEHNFAVPITNKELCTKTLNAKEIGLFKKSISKNFLFELYIDGLPVQGFVGSVLNAGKVDEYDNSVAEYYLFTHLHFVYLFNGDRIIHVSVSSESPDTNAYLLTDQEMMDVTFTYSSSWVPTEVKYKDRLSLLNPHRTKGDLEVHWLSIINSVVLVILLTGFITLILIRILHKDYVRYNSPKDEKLVNESEDDPDDYGWKLIYGDVFRFPKHFNYLTAFVGVGGQLLFVSLGVLLLSLLGWLYPEQSGSLYTAAIFLFLFGSFISGFISSYFYKQMEGDKWAWNVLLSLTLFALPVALISIIGDVIARFYHSTSALPFSTGVFIFGFWLVIGFPLTLLGGIAGKRSAGNFDAPVRTKTFTRQIPPIPLYRQMGVQMIVAGFLPFSAIYIELYYIYATIWGHSAYQLYGILFVVFIILLIVTASITVALTYFQLAAEDHRWWWRSFFSGGSTGIFMFAYSCYYYVYRSNMSGILQAVKYFTFVTISCYFFFVMLGTVGFYCSLLFVKHIYRTLKID